MAVKRWIGDRFQAVDTNGNPLTGAKLFFYAAGSSTKQNTYTTSAGNIANSNPLTLNSLGRPTTEIWLTEGLTYKVGLAAADESDPPGVFIWQEDNVSGVNDGTALFDEWVVSGDTPTFLSTTSFSVTGDKTDKYHPGRRIKSTNSGGTIYSTIVTSAFVTVTTVTVVSDGATVLDSGLSAMWVALVKAENTSAPLLSDAHPLRSGSADKTKKVRLEVGGLTTATTRVASVPDYDFRFGNLPAGIGPLPYAGATVPTGWLECDGSAVSRTDYSALFTAISTTWGSGDGSTTFNLPDMRGKVAIGAGTGTVTEAVTASSSNGFTVSSNNTKWITGMTVVLSNLTGFTTSATAGPTYYAVRISATNVRLASTLALAQTGAPDITLSGSGTATLTHTLTARTLAEQGGEETHAMSSTELLSHLHNQEGQAGFSLGGGGATVSFDVGQWPAALTTTATGGNAAMNIMQPFAVVKYIISY